MRTTMAWLLALALPAGLLSGCGAAQEETVPAGTEIHLDDAGITVDGEAISTEKTAAVYAANDFTYLVVSSPDLTAGDYTLWQGDTQLAGSASDGMGGPGAMGGGRPGGGTPPADGEAPPDGERPEGEEPAAGGEVPEGAEPPAGEEPPEGEAPERPDGEEPPAGGGRPEDGIQSDAERSETFPLTEGGNFFTGIAPLETEEDAASETAET